MLMRGLVLSVLLAGCGGDKGTLDSSKPETEADGDTDADTDSDTDADSDTDSDADTDADTDTDTDTDTTDPFGLDARPPNPDCVAPDPPLSSASMNLDRVYPKLSFDSPIWIGQAPGDADHWYVAEQGGEIFRFEDDPAVSRAETVTDLGGILYTASEAGLLGVAFHPDYPANSTVYLSYSIPGGTDHTSRISEVPVTAAGATFDVARAETVLSIDQPYSNHNGGHIAFGPDGYLYFGTGDGGSGGDPGDRAQNTSSLLGKMLRIDVDGGDPYAIPIDNPFAAGGGAPEVFAWGIRNPWRYSFDSATGDLWVGDVGQESWEEVSLVRRGGNYGWRLREGMACYNPPSGCPTAGLIDPYVVYPNSWGASVVAGVVYRGTDLSEIEGVLLYSDFYSGDIQGLFYDSVTGLPEGRTILAGTGRTISHYAEGLDGEVTVADHANGNLYRFARASDGPVDAFPTLLSETGCVDPSDPYEPADGVLPYDLNHPFWSDGAAKTRWLGLPDGATVDVDADGDLQFPVGTVLMKRFDVAGETPETRLFMRHPSGDWAGYAYKWRDDGSDADLLMAGTTVSLAASSWAIPSRAECVRCHSAAAGGALGLEVGQLERAMTYPSTGRVSNQLDTLEHIGVFSDPLPATREGWPDVGDASATVEDRARTYLHVNCSQCHRPGGPGRTEMDLRRSTALADTGLCDAPEHGDLGVPGALRVRPGAPESSLLSIRMGRRDAYQMPPIGSLQVDTEGLALIDEWITDMGTCP
jgi:uncharacterized repeat protein (TIGR03806 family)